MGLRKLISPAWVLFTIMIISLAFNVRSMDDSEGDYAYFRAHYLWGCIWSSREGTFRDKQVVNVLKRVGTRAPYITTLQEKDIAELLIFFESNGWEIVSHDADVSASTGSEYFLALTCVLRRK